MTARKRLSDLILAGREMLSPKHALLRLRPQEGEVLPEMEAGQFVEVGIWSSPSTFLRRPVSIHFVDKEANEMWLLVHAVGSGTACLCALPVGTAVDCLFPLGRGFSRQGQGKKGLLVGGGVGCAPLLFYGARLKEEGASPTFLLGGKSREDLLEVERFGQYGNVCLTTEDGSAGEKGFVTNHSILEEGNFDFVASCGPKPMMAAVAKWAKAKGLPCEVSLENLMACGLGACLCCVEKTVRGNVCVCKDGPVFSTEELTWQSLR